MKNLFKNKIYISILFCVIVLFIICGCVLSNIWFPNYVSKALDVIKNSGTEQQYFEEQSHLSDLKSATISNDRSDYPNLSDKEFANYHEIEALGLKTKMLYRSSSPIEPNSDRTLIAENYIAQDKIKNFINLDNTQDEALLYPYFKQSHHYQYNCVFAPIDMDMQSNQTKTSIHKILKYIEKEDGPFLLHCTDGATKTGIVCALLQALNTSSYDYLKAEYINGLKNVCISDNDLTGAIEMQFRNQLANALNLTSHNILYLNLNKYLCEYLRSCELTDETINNVKYKLKAE